MNFSKKILIILALISFQGLACADSGFFVGGALTYTQPVDAKFGVFSEEIIAAASGFQNVTLLSSSANRIGGAIMGGYHYKPESWGVYFLEGELIARRSGNELKNSTVKLELNDNITVVNYSLSIKQKDTFGTLLRLGKYFTDCIGAYLSAGVLNSKFQTTTTGIVETSPPQYSTASAKVNRVWGGRLGFGAIQDLGDSKAFSLRIDYGYEMYKKYSTGLLEQYNETDNAKVFSSMSPSLSYHVVTLSCVYKI
ncbi:MAG: hypothetical protein WCG05_00215 [Alphaproteobacteria bacterium]